MKKKLTAILVGLCSAFATIGFASCDIASILPDSSTLEQLETYTVDLDASKFNPVVPYGSDFSYKGLTLIYKQELGGEVFYETKIDVMEDMIVSEIDTDSVGEKQLVIEYEKYTWTVDYTVMYQVDFVAFDEVYTQYVLERDEIVVPEAPEVSGYEFAYWKTQLPETLSENLSIEAHYYDTSLKAPPLRPIERTYDPNATLADIQEQLALFSNKQGAWEFVDDETTPIGGAGTHEFEVRFVPATDEIAPQENRMFTVEVAKKLVTFKVENTSFVYDGEGHFPDVEPSDDVALIKFNQSEPQINAGSYQATFVVDEENYEGSVVIDYTITKPNVTIELDSKTITYGDALPAVTYKVTGFEETKLNLLNIQTTELVSNNAGVYPLTATIDNDNVDWTVKDGTLTINKAELGEVVYKLSTDRNPATYGDPISTVTFTESPLGTWEWKDSSALIDKRGGDVDDGYTAMAVFTHQNPNYNVKEVPLTINNIAKKEITITVTENQYTYTGEEYTIEYAVSGMMDFNTDYGVVTGNVEKTDAGTYSATLALESDYYTASVRTQLIINKAVPNVSFTKDNESVAWTPSLSLETSDIELKTYGNLDGAYRWVKWDGDAWADNKTASLSTCAIDAVNTFDVEYTPVDTVNYEKAYLKFNVVVIKAEQQITNVKTQFTYNGKAQALSANVSGVESPVITFELDGKEITTLENAGTYTITVKAAATDHYEAAETTVVVTVAKAENDWKQGGAPRMSDESWIYGETAGVASAQANFGAVSIKYTDRNGENEATTMPTAVGQYYAVFSVEGTSNYDGLPEERVAFEITQKTVTKPTLTQNSFVYTGSPITVAVTENTLYTFSGNTATNVGEYTITLQLTDSHNYAWSDSETDTTTLTFEITQASNSITNLTITGWKYKQRTSANAPSIESAKFGAGNVQYSYYVSYNDALNGSNAIENVALAEVGTYYVKAEIAEEAVYGNYAYTSAITSFAITQATPDVTCALSTTTLTWNSLLTLNNGVTISGNGVGSYAWKGNSGSQTLEVGEHPCTVVFTPTDTKNYTTKEFNFTVTVNQASGTITNVEETYTYTYRATGYTLSPSKNHSETALKYAYEYESFEGGIARGENLSSLTMTDAGVYTVTITLPESTHYTAAVVTTTVTINKVENTQTIGNNILNQTKTYGATVANLTLPANDAYGSWSWKGVTDTSVSLGGVKSYTYTAVYTPNNATNYASREVPVTVTVTPREITLPTVPQGYAPVYNTTEQTPIKESLDYTRVIKDEDGNGVSPIDAGSYTITLTLNDANFVWSDKTTEVKQFTYEIAKAEVIAPEFSASALKYNGGTQAPTVIWKDTTITVQDCDIENNGGTNVGSYPVTLTLKDTVRNNYKWAGTEDAYETSLPFAITLATATVENVTFTDNSWTYQQYDGTANAHSATATLDSGVTLTAEYKYALKNADGTYTEIENFNPDTANAGTYGIKAYVEACVVDGITNYAGAESVNWVDFEIEKAPVGAPTITTTGTLKYNETHTITVTPAVNGDLAKYSIAWSLTAQPSGTKYSGSADENGVITATNAGTYTVTFTLNGNYAWADSTFNGTRSFTIEKADNGFASGSPTIDGATYDETNEKYVGTYRRSAFEAAATAINGSFTITYAGSLTNGLPENYGDYTITFSVAESDNYKTFSETINLSIGKATPVVSLTSAAANIAWQSSITLESTNIQLAGSATYNDEAVAGTFNWITPTETWSGFEVNDTKEFTVGFYPTDTTNYNAVETLNFTISIIKAQATINGVQERYESDSLVYVEGKSYGLSDLGNITASSNNGTISGAEFALSWTHTAPDGTVTPNGSGAMTDAGTYELTIALSGVSATRYAATAKTTTVFIKQATVSFVQPDWEIKEGEKVSTLALYEVKDSNEKVVGVWTWQDADALIVDGNEYTVVFKSSNQNYSNNTPHTFKIMVNMLPLTISSTQTSNVYVGGDVTITVSVKASDNTVLTYDTHYTLKYSYNNGTAVEAQANEFKVQNAGTYTVTIILTEGAKETYYWANTADSTHTVTINSVTDVSVEDPTIEGWTYGTTPNEPKAEANYTFATVRYEYFDKDKKPIGKPTNTTPADDYYVRAVVDAQAPNYNGDTSDYVPFTIAPANYEEKFGEVTFTATYDTLTWDIGLTFANIKDNITLGGKIGENALVGTYDWGTNTTEALNATTYEFNVVLTVNDNYLPISGAVQVTIGTKSIDVPTLSITDGKATVASGETIYNGKAWKPTVVEKNEGDNKYYSSDAAKVSGTNFGEYKVTLSLNENCVWSEPFNDELSFKINKATVTAELDEASKNLVYNTEEQTAGITMSVTNPAGFAPTFVEGTDYELTNNTATYFNEGGYTLTVTLKNDNYQFDGGATEKTIDFAIAKATVTAKLASDKVKYTGSAAVLSVTVQTTDKKTTLTDYTLSATETNVGENYTLTVRLGETAFANYEFEDGQATALTYEIEKEQNAWANDATPSITASWTYGDPAPELTLPTQVSAQCATSVILDYTITYTNTTTNETIKTENTTVLPENMDAGEYTVTIVVEGNDNWIGFTDTLPSLFTIEKDDTEPEENKDFLNKEGTTVEINGTSFSSFYQSTYTEKEEERTDPVEASEYYTRTFTSADVTAVALASELTDSAVPTSVGRYILTLTLKNATNYKWPDELLTNGHWYKNEDGSIWCIYIINPKPVTIITLTNGTSVPYDGEYHLPVAEDKVTDNKAEQSIDMGDYTITITMSGSSDNVIDFGRDAGEYTITLALDNPNFAWASEVKEEGYVYTIKKATNNVTLTVTDEDGTQGGIQVIYKGSAIQPSLAGTPNTAGATWSYTGNDYNGGSVSSESGKSECPTNVGTYRVQVSIPATDNYEAGSGTLDVQFTITQAPRDKYEEKYGTVTFPTSITTQYQSGLTLGGVTIENAVTEKGTYTWAETDQALEVDETGTAYTMVFTPKDTNYAPIEQDVTVIVNRIPVTLSATKTSVTVSYDSAKTYTLTELVNTFGITKSESVDLAPAFTYEGKATEKPTAINVAGTYTITVTVADTAHYNANTLTLTLIIKQIELDVSTLNETRTATYGDLVSGLAKPTAHNTLGSWAWDVSEGTTVGNATASNAYNEFTAVFTPTDTVNYAEREVTVKVTVNKATVAAPTITTEGTLKYGEDYTITVTPEGDLAKYDVDWTVTAQPSGTTYTGEADANGVITATKAGTYTVTFTLKNTDNYKWASGFNGTRTFTIDKADNNDWSSQPESNKSYPYKAAAYTFTATTTVEMDQITASYYDLTDTTTPISAPKNVGDYYVKLVATDDNYKTLETDLILYHITQASLIITAPTYQTNELYQNQINLNNGTASVAGKGNDTLEGAWDYGALQFNGTNNNFQKLINATNDADITYNSYYTLTFTPTAGTLTAQNYSSASIRVYLMLKEVAYHTTDSGKTKTYYGTIENALAAATSGEVWVVPGDTSGNVVIETAAEIIEGVTLVLPYYNSKTAAYEINAPTYDEEIEAYKWEATLANASVSNLNSLRCNTRVVLETTLTVNGTLMIGGELHGSNGNTKFAGHTHGGYAEIIMKPNASIAINGTVRCFGFIHEVASGEIVYSNGHVVSGAPGNGSTVVVNRGGTLGMPFVLNDFRGGNYMAGVYAGTYTNAMFGVFGESQVSPFNQFELRNVTSLLQVNCGGALLGYANLYANSAQNATSVKLIGSDSDYLIELTESEYSYLTAKYNVDNNSYVATAEDAYCELHIYGGADINAMQLTVDATIDVVTIDTSEVYFPLSWRYHITLDVNEDKNQSSAIYNANEQKFKMLPGSRLTIAQGATLDIAELSVYKEFVDNAVYENDAGNRVAFNNRYPTKDPAALIVNGTLIVGKLGGEVNSNNPDAKIQVTTAGSLIKEATFAELGLLGDGGEYDLNEVNPLSLSKYGGGTYTGADTYYSVRISETECVWIGDDIDFDITFTYEESDGTEFVGDVTNNLATTYKYTDGIDNDGIYLASASTDTKPDGNKTYVFKGWYIKASNGDGTYTYTRIRTLNGYEHVGGITLVGVFEAVDTAYKINFESITANDKTYTLESISIGSAYVNDFDPYQETYWKVEAHNENIELSQYFEGWYIDNDKIELGDLVNYFLDSVEVTLTGRWADKHVLTVNVGDCGNVNPSVTQTVYLNPEQAYTLPVMTGRDQDETANKYFINWNISGSAVIEDNVIALSGNATITATWGTKVIVEFNNEGSIIATYYVKPGDSFVTLASAEKATVFADAKLEDNEEKATRYSFAGWKIGDTVIGGNTTYEVPETAVDGSTITFTAQFTSAEVTYYKVSATLNKHSGWFGTTYWPTVVVSGTGMVDSSGTAKESVSWSGSKSPGTVWVLENTEIAISFSNADSASVADNTVDVDSEVRKLINSAITIVATRSHGILS